MGSGVKVADLKLTKQTDAHHLNARQDQDTGNDEDGAVDLHDVLAGKNLEHEQPNGESGAGGHAKRPDGSEEVQRPCHVLQQKADGEQIEEDAQRAKRAVEKDIVNLVSEATEAVVHEKVDARKDADVIDKALKGRKK